MRLFFISGVVVLFSCALSLPIASFIAQPFTTALPSPVPHADDFVPNFELEEPDSAYAHIYTPDEPPANSLYAHHNNRLLEQPALETYPRAFDQYVEEHGHTPPGEPFFDDFY